MNADPDKRVCALAGLFVLLAAVSAGAQNLPDFTGTWTQIDPPLSPNATHVVQVEQKGLRFTLKVEKSGDAGPFGYGFRDERTYTIGAVPEARKGEDGRIRSVALDWEGDALVFVRTTQEGANTTIERDAWLLSNDGTRLTRVRRTTDWQGTSIGQTTFARK